MVNFNFPPACVGGDESLLAGYLINPFGRAKSAPPVREGVGDWLSRELNLGGANAWIARCALIFLIAQIGRAVKGPKNSVCRSPCRVTLNEKERANRRDSRLTRETIKESI